MRQSLIPRAAVVAILAAAAAGSLLISAAGATHGHQAQPVAHGRHVLRVAAQPARAAMAAHPLQDRVLSACLIQDTSGSSLLQCKGILVEFKPGATVISVKKDKNHPYGVVIVVSPISGTVKPPTIKPNLFSILLPTATQAKSIQAGFNINVAEDPSGVFTLQVTDDRGHRIAIWTPPLKLVPPVGYKYLQTLTRAGWVRTNYNRVQTPGLYRWVKS